MIDRDEILEPSEEGIELLAGPSDEGKRADAFFAEHTDLTRSAVVRLLEKGNIHVNDAVPDKKYESGGPLYGTPSRKRAFGGFARGHSFGRNL